MAFQITWIFKGLQVIGLISKWSEKALADGKVTLQEGIELIGALGAILGLPLELEIPGVTIPEKLQEVLDQEETEQPPKSIIPGPQ